MTIPLLVCSPGIAAGKTGTLSTAKRHDYLPFGEELSAGTGSRTTSQGYTSDNLRQKFTGYESDVETGLDFAQARYYSSSQGRFTSIDPLLASGRAAEPQSWNRYAYVVNKPLNMVDPRGMDGNAANEQRRQQMSGQQPQQPQPLPVPPPVDSSLAGSPEFVAQNPIPAGITYTYGQPHTYQYQRQTYADGTVSNDRVTGVAMNVAISVVDDTGAVMTSESGILMTEVVIPDPNQSTMRAAQNTQTVSPNSNGIIPDTIGPLTNTPQSPAAAAQAMNWLNNNKVTMVATQTLYISAPNRGVVLTATNQISFTNVDSQGNISGFKFTHTPGSLTSAINPH